MVVLIEREIADEFPDEHLMVLRSKFKDDEPCASVMARKILWDHFPILEVIIDKITASKDKSEFSFVGNGVVEIIDKSEFSFKVNGQRLKKYYEGNIDKEDDEVIEFENGVT
ncbi:hypothetical protein Tco_0094835 [Tanacetum coccineum]